MALTVRNNPLIAYRAGLSSADSDLTALHAATFTRSSNPIPVIPVVGLPTVDLSAQFSNAAATVSVTLVALNIANDGTITIMGVGAPIPLTAGAARFASDSQPATTQSQYLAPFTVSDAYGAKGTLPGGGPVTHVAWLVSTSASAGTVDLWSWGNA